VAGLFQVLPPVLRFVATDVFDDVADQKADAVSVDELARLYGEVAVMRAADLLLAGGHENFSRR
jgi:archaeosine-15-forming tRNA-guanine transglycosylase